MSNEDEQQITLDSPVQSAVDQNEGNTRQETDEK